MLFFLFQIFPSEIPHVTVAAISILFLLTIVVLSLILAIRDLLLEYFRSYRMTNYLLYRLIVLLQCCPIHIKAF